MVWGQKTTRGRRSWVRLHEKGGKRHKVPCHHSLGEYLDAWIAAAKLADDKKGPLFRSFKKGDKQTTNPLARPGLRHTSRTAVLLSTLNK